MGRPASWAPARSAGFALIGLIAAGFTIALIADLYVLWGGAW